MVFIEYVVPHAGEYVMVAENSTAPFSVIGPQRELAGGLKVFKLFSREPLSNATLGDIFQNLTVLTERCAFSTFVHSFPSIHAFQFPADLVRCSRHSMAALQPALPWDFLHHVNESPAYCRRLLNMPSCKRATCLCEPKLSAQSCSNATTGVAGGLMCAEGSRKGWCYQTC